MEGETLIAAVNKSVNAILGRLQGKLYLLLLITYGWP